MLSLIERAKSLLVTTQLSVSGEMTYRTDPKTGQKVSLLGYGCMRWPPAIRAKDGCPIDQEVVNELIDYAIERGVNYFDTAPIYGQGWSETVTGKAKASSQRTVSHCRQDVRGIRPFTREPDSHVSSLVSAFAG